MTITPSQGSCSGGFSVIISGTNLAGTTSVKFGSAAATLLANTDTSVTVLSPAGTGAVNVAVTTGGGTSNYLAFYYIQPPIMKSLSDISGVTDGGNTILINGFNFASAFRVYFGGNYVTPTVINDGQVSAVAPTGDASGTVRVYVETKGGITTSLNYVYVDVPGITELSPASGQSIGGTVVTITGTNFTTTTSVTFDEVAAAFGVLSDTTLAVVTPAGTIGTVDVVVTTTGGIATATDGFTYVGGPSI